MIRCLTVLLLCGIAFAEPWQWLNPLPQGNTLHDVVFPTASDGWAVGDAGTILHTGDGGTTWEAQSSGTFYSLRRVAFRDSLTGWIAGGDESG